MACKGSLRAQRFENYEDEAGFEDDEDEDDEFAAEDDDEEEEERGADTPAARFAEALETGDVSRRGSYRAASTSGRRHSPDPRGPWASPEGPASEGPASRPNPMHGWAAQPGLLGGAGPGGAGPESDRRQAGPRSGGGRPAERWVAQQDAGGGSGGAGGHPDWDLIRGVHTGGDPLAGNRRAPLPGMSEPLEHACADDAGWGAGEAAWLRGRSCGGGGRRVMAAAVSEGSAQGEPAGPGRGAGPGSDLGLGSEPVYEEHTTGLPRRAVARRRSLLAARRRVSSAPSRDRTLEAADAVRAQRSADAPAAPSKRAGAAGNLDARLAPDSASNAPGEGGPHVPERNGAGGNGTAQAPPSGSVSSTAGAAAPSGAGTGSGPTTGFERARPGNGAGGGGQPLAVGQLAGAPLGIDIITGRSYSQVRFTECCC